MQSSPEQQGYKLPATVNPPDSVCFQIPVPNDPAYIQAFIGALYDLTLWNSWQRDPAHKGILAAQVWKRIWTSVTAQWPNCPTVPTPIEEWEDELSLCESLRFNPATGLFEGLCCGVWTTIPGQPSSGFLGAQNGNGTPQPAAGGGCQTYHMTLNGREQAVLPAPVNTGDTITVSNLKGAWYDGSGVWNCPTGGLFFAGLCGPTSVVGSDPIPGGPHMCLVTKIGGVYHNISDGAAYTVAGGVTNLLCVFQANDSTLTDDGGDISFDVTVCNNQTATWSHLFDFTTSAHGGAQVGANNGIWTAGVGLQGQLNTGTYIIRWDIPIPSATTLTAIQYTGDSPDANANQTLVQTYDVANALIHSYSDTNPLHAAYVGKTVLISGSSPATRKIRIDSWDSVSSNVKCSQVILYGTGPQPAWP